MKELSFPLIFENGVKVGYGGDQDWFSREIQRKAGCASVAGANLAAYYAANFAGASSLYKGSANPFRKDEYISAMEDMYRYMTPGPVGFPYPERFASQFGAFAESRGVSVKPRLFMKAKGYEKCADFVRAALDEGHPVPLLILHHRAARLTDDNWHWVTITGWLDGPDGGDVVFSDCGSRDLHPARVLFENHWSNVLHMVRFSF